VKTALVCGAGGFFGNHLVKRLKQEDYFVIGVDLKYPEFCKTQADYFLRGDLRKQAIMDYIFTKKIDEVYQLAADLGGAGYIFTGKHDANIMSNSALININIAKKMVQTEVKKLFFPSSTCVYPANNITVPNKYGEENVYPAQPDNEYGWEKLFSERLYLAYKRNYGLDVRIMRIHGIFGTECAWNNGKEYAPAAMCRRVSQAKDGDLIDIWGDGKQTRSYLYIDECINGVRLLMSDDQSFEPLNMGAEEIVSINQLAEIIIEISGKKLKLNHVEGPLGVRGTNSDNRLLYKRLNWKPNYSLRKGLEQTYSWINNQVHDNDKGK